MDWKECLNKRLAKKVQIDVNMISSLIKTSENKLASEEKLIINEITADSKVSLAYDSLRELLEALSIKFGYKIYNHEGYTPFLKEILKETIIGEEFDELRKIRNSINYYGKTISEVEALNVIGRIKALRQKIQRLLSNKKPERKSYFGSLKGIGPFTKEDKARGQFEEKEDLEDKGL